MFRRLWWWFLGTAEPRHYEHEPPYEALRAPAGMTRTRIVAGHCSCCTLWPRYCACTWPFCKGGHRP